MTPSYIVHCATDQYAVSSLCVLVIINHIYSLIDASIICVILDTWSVKPLELSSPSV